jgi:hypothetical protein
MKRAVVVLLAAALAAGCGGSKPSYSQTACDVLDTEMERVNAILGREVLMSPIPSDYGNNLRLRAELSIRYSDLGCDFGPSG